MFILLSVLRRKGVGKQEAGAEKETSEITIYLEFSFRPDPRGGSAGALVPPSDSLGCQLLCSCFTQSLAMAILVGGEGVES